jgi:hypothetical protein
LYAVVTLVLAIRFSVISSRFRLKWRWIHQLIIRMPNWFWFPKNRTHFPEYDFHQRNRIQQPWNWSRIVHTNSRMWSKHTLDILFIELLKTVFGSTLFFFLKKATTQPRISCRWESSEHITMFRSTNLYYRKRTRTNFFWPVIWTI